VDVTAATGINQVGGFIGQPNFGVINDCYSRGSVQGGNAVGGFTGVTSGSQIKRCYSTGLVIASGSTKGGFVGGYSGGTVENCFWDVEASGLSTSPKGTGKTTAEMKTPSTFVCAGWDFNTIWGMDGNINEGYPNLEIPTPGVIQILWTGAVDNDWFNAANWLCEVPGTGSVVVIPDVSGTSGNFPVISGATAALCGSLTIESGASVTVNPCKALTVSGTLTNHGIMFLPLLITHWQAYLWVCI